MRIGLFDSGIGGLTVLKTLLRKYPHNEYIYVGDNKNIPYGNKTIDELKQLSSRIIEFLITKEVDLIVIACGTISTNIYEYLINKYPIKIINIVDTVIKYLNNSKLENILIIGTNNTINSHYFKKNINKNIYEIATPKLVPLIENQKYSNINNVLEEYLNLYKNIPNILLGCTHYPIIKDHILKFYNNNINIIDMSEYLIIENTANQINSYQNKYSKNNQKNIILLFTKVDNNLKKNIKYILNTDLIIKQIDL